MKKESKIITVVTYGKWKKIIILKKKEESIFFSTFEGFNALISEEVWLGLQHYSQVNCKTRKLKASQCLHVYMYLHQFHYLHITGNFGST